MSIRKYITLWNVAQLIGACIGLAYYLTKGDSTSNYLFACVFAELLIFGILLYCLVAFKRASILYHEEMRGSRWFAFSMLQFTLSRAFGWMLIFSPPKEVIPVGILIGTGVLWIIFAFFQYRTFHYVVEV